MEEAVDVRQMHPDLARGDLPLPRGLDPEVLGPMPQMHQLPFVIPQLPCGNKEDCGIDERDRRSQDAAEASEINTQIMQGGETAALERLQVTPQHDAALVIILTSNLRPSVQFV